MVGKNSLEAVVPLYASANNISIFPNEVKRLILEFESQSLSEEPVLIWKGINVDAEDLEIK